MLIEMSVGKKRRISDNLQLAAGRETDRVGGKFPRVEMPAVRRDRAGEFRLVLEVRDAAASIGMERRASRRPRHTPQA